MPVVRVDVIDDLSTGTLENLAAVRSHPGLRLIQARVSDCSELPALASEAEAIYHLAAAVGVELVLKEPVRTIQTNLQETTVILDAASQTKVPIVLTSTSEVYGLSTDVPFREDGNLVMGATTKGRWSYACSKAIDEFLALAYWREKKLPTIVVRLFITVGPRQTGQYGMVIPTFVKQALAGRPITVYGDGKQTRCFGYVGDVVGALMKLMDLSGVLGQVFNIGSNVEISILELAERVKKITRSDSEIVFVPYDQAYEEGFEDMQRRVPNTAKLRNLIGYEPKITLDEILRSVVEYQRARKMSGRDLASPLVTA